MMDIVAKNKVMVILLIPIIFFRFYKISEFITFLGDQGRDAIVIKRILTLEHLPAIGPTSSVGSVFLGPLYYYLVAPFMLFSWFNPVGLAIGIAILSVIGLCLLYFVIQKEVDTRTALFTFTLAGFSWVVLEFSRFSWNPNLLPFIGFFATYCFFKMCTRTSLRQALLFGLLFGFASLHLHYLTLLMAPFYLILFFVYLIRTKKRKNLFFAGITAFAGFLFMMIPLLFFDLKNNFLNTKNLLAIFSKGELVNNTSYLGRIQDTTETFIRHALGVPIPFFLVILMLGVILYLILREKKEFKILLLFQFSVVVWYLTTFAKLNSFRYQHYYMYIYICFYFIVAYALTIIAKNKIGLAVSILGIVAFFIINLQSYKFLYFEGNHQIYIAQTVVQSILDHNPQSPYQIVSLPSTETDDHFRYFLELANKRPLPADTLGEPKELYILCHAEKCDALNDGQWQVAAFKNKKVATIWDSYGITIYKIIHGK